MDRQKVIKGVESCIKMGRLGVENCRELNCPYFENGLRLSCWIDVLADALTLLKEQQPKTGCWIPWQPDSYVGSETFTCSYCRNNTKHPYPTKTPDEYLFCPYCGAKMEA